MSDGLWWTVLISIPIFTDSDELKKVILDQYQVLCDWVDILVAEKPELKTSAQSLYEIYTNKEIYHDIPEPFFLWKEDRHIK